MDIDRLHYFCTIVSTGSLRKASEILGLSAPALSKAMKQLEEELGVSLFFQEGRQLVPTEKGRMLAQEGSALLISVDQLKEKILSRTDVEKSVRIATFEVFSTYFLSCLDRIGWDARSLVLHEVLPGELEKAVREGHVDFGITYMPIAQPQIDFLKVTSIEMGVYAHRDGFVGEDQRDIPFVIPVTPLFGPPSRVRGLDGWPEDAYPRKVRYQVTLMETALELCRQGKCAGYFPSFIVEGHNRRMREEFHLRRVSSPYGARVCMTDVFLVKRSVDEENATAKQLAKAIRLVCGAEAGDFGFGNNP